MSKAEKFIQEHTKNCSNLAHLEDLKGNVWEEKKSGEINVKNEF